MDGSGAPFIFLIQSAGIEEQNAPKRFVRVLRRSRSREGDKWARFEPYQWFPPGLLHRLQPPWFQRASQRVIDFATNSYVKEIARARTFGFMQDVEMMRAQGLALGGSLDNASSWTTFGFSTPTACATTTSSSSTRSSTPSATCTCSATPSSAPSAAHKSGHALNNRLARQLLSETERLGGRYASSARRTHPRSSDCRRIRQSQVADSARHTSTLTRDQARSCPGAAAVRAVNAQ